MDTYIRCVFCLTGHESAVSRRIQDCLGGEVIIPKKIKPFHVNGKWIDKEELLMPGYLFHYSDQALPFISLKRIEGVARILTYGEEDKEGYLMGRDCELAEWFRRENGLVDKLDAIQEGDFIRIVDGALKEMQGKVIALNRRRHSVNVEVTLFGAQRSVWLGYEVVEKQKDTAQQ